MGAVHATARNGVGGSYSCGIGIRVDEKHGSRQVNAQASTRSLINEKCLPDPVSTDSQRVFPGIPSELVPLSYWVRLSV